MYSITDALDERNESFTGTCTAIEKGMVNGIVRAKNDYKELFMMLGEGFLSGILSSITSTIANVFATTSANTGRIIRQSWASLVEATSILFFNENEQYLCDRMTSATKVLATGASVIVGTVVQETVSVKLSELKVQAELNNMISVFAGSLCTGLMSVSLLFYIDNGPFTAFLIDIYGKGVEDLKEQSILFREYCAELENIDVTKLKKETDYIYMLSKQLESSGSQNETNCLLKQAIIDLGLPSLFENKTLDDCMQNPEWVLKF